MYRTQIILARNISIAVLRRGRPLKLPQSIATLTRCRYWTQSIDCCARLGKSIRRRTVASVVPPVIALNYSAERVAHALARGH